MSGPNGKPAEPMPPEPKDRKAIVRQERDAYRAQGYRHSVQMEGAKAQAKVIARLEGATSQAAKNALASVRELGVEMEKAYAHARAMQEILDSLEEEFPDAQEPQGEDWGEKEPEPLEAVKG